MHMEAERIDRMPRSGELYRHFTDQLYQIVAVAEHAKTREQLVVYQALYGDYKVYAEPLEMFLGEVDHAKYPALTQKYCFERVERETCKPSCPENALQSGRAESGAPQSERAESGASQSRQTEENDVNPKLLAFFDADTLEEKYNILISMRDEVDHHLINSMAVAIDVVIPEGEVDLRYEQLKNCIRTKQRYETQRLR